MMLVSIVVSVLSLLIQGTVSNYIGYTYSNLSIFSTVYVLVSLLIINIYFENKKKYLILLIVFGLILDLVYTNTFLLNTFLFIATYYFSKAFHFFFPYNLLTINISNLLSIFIYHIISFFLLVLLKYDNYTIWMLTKIVTHSIMMTIIYTSTVYLIIEFVKKKFELKEVK